ncbi:porin [Serratia symbiotica]|uniref:porin n=1 Tax=Serratia symbiotica TaxID=138074 RepID=UPI0030CAC6F6
MYNNKLRDGKDNAAGFSKIGQRYIKLKGEVGGAALNVQWGWQTLRDYGVISRSTRLSPSSYLGCSGGATRAGLPFRGAYIERSMARHSPESLRLKTYDGRVIGHLTTAELGYKNDLFNGQFAYCESQDCLRRQILRLVFSPYEKLTLCSQIYTTQVLDSYQAMALSKRHFDRNANHYAFDVKWQEPRCNLKLGIAQIRAPKGEGTLGFYPRHMTKDSRGTFTSMANMEAYMADGETMLGMEAEYGMTPEFTAGLLGTYGQFDYQGVRIRLGEINAFGRWPPSQSQVEKIVGPGWSHKHQNNTHVIADGRYQTSHSLAAEFIAEYRFKLF